jgi:hypothetical protein
MNFVLDSIPLVEFHFLSQRELLSAPRQQQQQKQKNFIHPLRQ